MSKSRINELVERYKMIEHPEGGFYKEQFRSKNKQEQREVLSSIYYLLFDQHVSNLHVIDSDEAWYHHEGDDLIVHTFHPENGYEALILGKSPDAEQFHIVEAGTIFGSQMRNSSGHALVSCAVAPAFLFEKFELVERNKMLELFPNQANIIQSLTRD